MTGDEEDLFAQLDDVFAKVDAEEHDDFSDEKTWPKARLIREMSRLTNLVKDERQILHPRNQDMRDAHSRRNAIQVELHRRGVL